MAEAGFYLVGNSNEPDLVRCYYCRRELDGWEPADVPWDEHKRRQCPYISLGKLPHDLTVEDAFQLEAERKCIMLVWLGYNLRRFSSIDVFSFNREKSLSWLLKISKRAH